MQIGLFSATILVICNMVGSGIFMMPAVLAGVGMYSMLAWPIALCGVLSLSFIFIKLTQIYTNSNGPYYYARHAFGNNIGFIVCCSYFLAAWIGNISLVVLISGYLQNTIPIISGYMTGIIFELAVVWVVIFIVARGGIRLISFLQTINLFLIFIPIFFVMFFGFIAFDINNFLSNWHVSAVNINSHNTISTNSILSSSNLAQLDAIKSGINTILWAFIGLESACVSSRLIKNPKRNVQLASMIGLCIVSVIYISTCVLIMGIVPYSELANSSSPFSIGIHYILLASYKYFNLQQSFIIDGLYLKYIHHFLNLCTVFACFSSLIGWTLLIGHTASSAAKDGLFPAWFKPKQDDGMLHDNNISKALVLIGIAMTCIVLIFYTPNIKKEFLAIIAAATGLYFIAYMYSSFAIIYLYLMKYKNQVINYKNILLKQQFEFDQYTKAQATHIADKANSHNSLLNISIDEIKRLKLSYLFFAIISVIFCSFTIYSIGHGALMLFVVLFSSMIYYLMSNKQINS